MIEHIDKDINNAFNKLRNVFFFIVHILACRNREKSRFLL